MSGQMCWMDAHWAQRHRRRLIAMGAPQAVRDRWDQWLSAADRVPYEPIRSWLATQLDDPDAPMPGHWNRKREALP